jgi:translation initiation factor 2B subunit (eIF-2B alpha/beta/delta family)
MDVKEKIPLVFGVPGKKFFDHFSAPEAFVAELRPGLEGIKKTAAGLLKKGIQPVIICDNMMAFCMERGRVERVIIFASSISKKSARCRTGSLIAALCAKAHGIPVVVYRSAPLKKAGSLLKIAGQPVTSGRMKTFVPTDELVPLEYITETAYA